MIIETNNKAKIPLSKIEVGEVFKIDNYHYIKTDGYVAKHDERRCVCMETGRLYYCKENFEVEPVTAKVVIE